MAPEAEPTRWVRALDMPWNFKGLKIVTKQGDARIGTYALLARMAMRKGCHVGITGPYAKQVYERLEILWAPNLPAAVQMSAHMRHTAPAPPKVHVEPLELKTEFNTWSRPRVRPPVWAWWAVGALALLTVWAALTAGVTMKKRAAAAWNTYQTQPRR